MKIQFHEKDAPVIQQFLSRFIPEKPSDVQSNFLLAWSHDECEILFLDTNTEELANCFMELEKEGFVQSIKRLYQGDHFYRSDTGKCPRCWRYRPEIHWNNENIPECKSELCDRCCGAVREGR